jgi:hypothetical protein
VIELADCVVVLDMTVAVGEELSLEVVVSALLSAGEDVAEEV